MSEIDVLTKKFGKLQKFYTLQKIKCYICGKLIGFKIGNRWDIINRTLQTGVKGKLESFCSMKCYKELKSKLQNNSPQDKIFQQLPTARSHRVGKNKTVDTKLQEKEKK